MTDSIEETAEKVSKLNLQFKPSGDEGHREQKPVVKAKDEPTGNYCIYFFYFCRSLDMHSVILWVVYSSGSSDGGSGNGYNWQLFYRCLLAYIIVQII